MADCPSFGWFVEMDELELAIEALNGQ